MQTRQKRFKKVTTRAAHAALRGVSQPYVSYYTAECRFRDPPNLRLFRRPLPRSSVIFAAARPRNRNVLHKPPRWSLPHIPHGELHFLQKQYTSAFVAHVNMFHSRPTTPPTPQRTVFKLPSSESIKALGKASYYIGYMFLQRISCCQCLARRPAPCDSILPQPRSTLDCAAAAAPGATSPRLERLPRLHSPPPPVLGTAFHQSCPIVPFAHAVV
jgi:hypothetical protein